ncbi:MAG: UvrD-helicase domain-containing protein, partial [Candidatus Bathyarchaeota archaeon]
MTQFIPTDEQKAIINSQASALVDAGPGTGKTRTAVEKAYYELCKLHDDSHQNILFLSFSNASLYRLMNAWKVELPTRFKRKVRFRTYHAAALEILRNYGRFVNLPPTIKVMDTLEEKLVSLELEWEQTNEDYQHNLIQFAKKTGLLAFSTLLPLLTKLLESSDTLRNIIGRGYKLIIVDEFQDTSKAQWHFLRILGENTQVVAFGDPNQIIYSSLHAATAKRFDEFCEWKGIDISEFSSTNFRCDGAEILDFAKALLKGKPYREEADSRVQLIDIKYRNRLVSYLALI